MTSKINHFLEVKKGKVRKPKTKTIFFLTRSQMRNPGSNAKSKSRMKHLRNKKKSRMENIKFQTNSQNFLHTKYDPKPNLNPPHILCFIRNFRYHQIKKSRLQ